MKNSYEQSNRTLLQFIMKDLKIEKDMLFLDGRWVD